MSMPLAMTSEGSLVKVVEVNLSRDWQHRLAEMGIRLGEEILVHRVEKGSIIIEHSESRWVVGRGISMKVEVSPIDE